MPATAGLLLPYCASYLCVCGDRLTDRGGGGKDMNLSNLLHQHTSHATTSRPRSLPSRSHFDNYRAAPSRTSHRLPERDMASALIANPYPGQHPVFTQAPHHPPSPPVEGFHNKRTLPSIQSLIGRMAESPSADTGQQRKPTMLSGSMKQQ